MSYLFWTSFILTLGILSVFSIIKNLKEPKFEVKLKERCFSPKKPKREEYF